MIKTPMRYMWVILIHLYQYKNHETYQVCRNLEIEYMYKCMHSKETSSSSS